MLPLTYANRATEYVAGTTSNPLVIGSNDTMNSDKRIFSSDGNVTMQAYVPNGLCVSYPAEHFTSFASSPAFFSSTCSKLFERMLNTVPRGVQLTDVIDPLAIKPQKIALIYMGDGGLRLTGEIRVCSPNISCASHTR